ncbi:uracil-DNA glycosylase [Patescibacteria group bacterium]|nr:uracil-DNA glycosylase [Patescibacteria group bacterium]MBU1683704.1 uracil-DNA glycosylase [Patescibacteria group bacterium]MBU1935258.1 uracil-DNA glycosylase [Patescibacteria group bacterium]
MDVKIEQSWQEVLEEEFSKPYFEELTNFVREEYGVKKVFPPPKDIFKAFDLCPFDKVKVVMLGQDPYHGPGQAHGLCFSVNQGVPMPPSLVNIYKEIQSDVGGEIPKHGNLEHWAEQGVFLLNAILSVVAGMPTSHQNKGWETFTDEVIRLISEKKEHVVFMLWGAYAQSKEWMIDDSKHLVLKAPHPSPLSAHRGFFGCKHFSKANKYLRENGLKEIEWI